MKARPISVDNPNAIALARQRHAAEKWCPIEDQLASIWRPAQIGEKLFREQRHAVVIGSVYIDDVNG